MNLASAVSREWADRLSRVLPDFSAASGPVTEQAGRVVEEMARWLRTSGAEPDGALRSAFRELTRRMRTAGIPTPQALEGLALLEEVLAGSGLVTASTNSTGDADRLRLGLRGMLLDAVRVNTALDARLSRERADALEFFGEVLVHEIGNRLGAAQTAAELLRTPSIEIPPGRQDDLLRLIGEGVEQALKSVDDVTALMVAQAGPEENALPARQIVEQVARTLSPIARRDGVWLDTELDEAGDRPVDAARMRLILTNLAMNGIRYRARDRDGSFVVLRAVCQGDDLLLEVQDNGMGIPEGEQEGIFHYRERGSASGRQGIHGSGLGLAVVAEAASQMGASVELESQVGVGSTFRLRIPVRVQSEV